jgi:hypothetical protein
MITREQMEVVSYCLVALGVATLLFGAFNRWRISRPEYLVRKMVRDRINADLVEVETRADRAQEFWRALTLARARERCTDLTRPGPRGPDGSPPGPPGTDFFALERERNAYRYKGMSR